MATLNNSPASQPALTRVRNIAVDSQHRGQPAVRPEPTVVSQPPQGTLAAAAADHSVEPGIVGTWPGARARFLRLPQGTPAELPSAAKVDTRRAMDLVTTVLERAQAEGRAVVMGIVNVTPDSFYDGGRYLDNSAAIVRIQQLVQEGADIIDLGAESSRPGSVAVSADTQLERLIPPLEFAVAQGLAISIDTTHPEVAAACLARGAHIINDVSCLRDTGLASAAAQYGSWLILMHSRAPMSEMKGFSLWPDDDYRDIVEDVANDWGEARSRAINMGVTRSKIIFDPGFGFSKNARHSFELLQRLREFKSQDALIMSGVSRKSFLSWNDPAPPAQRLGGSIAGAVLSLQQGADLLRVHDVLETRQAQAVLLATQSPALARPPRT